MKLLNTSKKLLPLLLLPLASTVDAKIQPLDVSFTVLPEITVTEVRAMNFGSVLKLAAAATCTLTANVTNMEGPSLTKSDVAAAGTPGLLAGTCAGGDAGTVGVYEITAIQGSDVNITVTGETNADISFAPAGYAVDFGGTLGGGDDTPTLVPNNTSTAITVPATAEFNANVNPGVLRLVLGGTITNQRTLVADTAVSAGLTVDVVY